MTGSLAITPVFRRETTNDTFTAQTRKSTQTTPRETFRPEANSQMRKRRKKVEIVMDREPIYLIVFDSMTDEEIAAYLEEIEERNKA